MKVDEWENLKSNMYAIDAAISMHLQEKFFKIKSDIAKLFKKTNLHR